MGAIARHKVLNILHSERGLDMLLANDSCTKQGFVLIRTDAGGWLSRPHEQRLRDNQRERERDSADNGLASQQERACTKEQTNKLQHLQC